jgi:hypothetical protein
MAIAQGPGDRRRRRQPVAVLRHAAVDHDPGVLDRRAVAVRYGDGPGVHRPHRDDLGLRREARDVEPGVRRLLQGQVEIGGRRTHHPGGAGDAGDDEEGGNAEQERAAGGGGRHVGSPGPELPGRKHDVG